MKRKTWNILCREEVPDDTNIPTGRFELAIKMNELIEKYGKPDLLFKDTEINSKNHMYVI